MPASAANFTRTDTAQRAAEEVQLRLPIEDAPALMREYGYQDAHRRPLVSPNVGLIERSYRVPSAAAWDFPRLELRAGNSYPVITLDCDGPEAVDRLMAAVVGADLKQPNVFTQRKTSGNCHGHFMLAAPVHRGESARITPLRYFARIVEFYQVALLADPAFSGVLTLNPCWRGPELRTYWVRSAPYELAELAEPIPPGWRRPRVAQSGVGRNFDLFRWAVKEAHRPRSARLIAAAAVRDAPEWIAIVNAHNVETWGTLALAYDEVRHVARHAAGYSLRQYSEARFSDIQRIRGRRSYAVRTEGLTFPEVQRKRQANQARKRRAGNRERDRAILADRAAGLSLRAIAARHGVGKSTVDRVLRQRPALTG